MTEKGSRLVYSTEKVMRGKEKQDHSASAAEHPSAPKQVYVRLERKGRCGKSVVIISGFQGSRQAMEAVLKLLKSRLGTGGTLRGETLEIQGDHREVVSSLLQDLGYRAKQSGG
ncbi:MAG: translation initiation factor [Dissulfurispiraceae bacterium]